LGGSARISKAPGSLIGRNDDLEYITAYVDRAAVSGGALLLSGEAGVGKSVLLDAAAAHAETAGTRVLRAGLHDKVAALVYVAAFAPGKGESVNTLIAGFPAGGPQPPILPPKDGFLFLDREKFAASFAADLPAGQAAFMADSQVPWGVNALGGMISEAAWRIKPSWYLVASDDRMIPPPAQRAMSERVGSTVAEASGSHSIYLSQPAAVAALITQAMAATRG
jgi:pimeloyl-ACP methyl ester carboxylesterase